MYINAIEIGLKKHHFENLYISITLLILFVLNMLANFFFKLMTFLYDEGAMISGKLSDIKPNSVYTTIILHT